MEDVVEQQRELPHDLIAQNILTRLSIRTLVRCKSVSKQWFSTISSHQFAHAHAIFPRPSQAQSLLIRSNEKFICFCYRNGDINMINVPVDFDNVDRKFVLVGSCNGLVCLGSTSGSMFIIWNPFTHKFREFQDDSEICDCSAKKCSIIWGFGYVSATDDYKIVRISKKSSHPSMRVDVFSLRLRKWRRIVEDSSHPNFFDSWGGLVLRQGALVDETLYWMDGTRSNLRGKQRTIYSFDLRLKLFNTLPQLDVSSRSGWDMGGNDEYYDEFLCVLKGCLSKYGTFLSDEGVITILKHDGATERIHVPKDLIASTTEFRKMYCNNMIGFRGSDKIFTVYVGWHVPHIGIIDLSSRPLKHTQLATLERTSYITKLVAYSPSLISPDAITSKPESNI